MIRILLLLLPILLPVVAAADPAPLRRDNWRSTVTLNRDLTYTQIIEQNYSFLTSAGIPLADRDYVTVHPESQSVELLEAWVTQPDGTRIDVPESARFTRPSQSAQETPGFTGSETTTILFPQLKVGSKTHVKWRISQKTPPVLGFNLMTRPLLEWPTRRMTIEVSAPADLPLRWEARGGFVASSSVRDGLRTLSAEIVDVAPEEPERNMVAASDFQPMLAVTTLPGLEALGAIYHRQAADKAVVTPEIAALSSRIVGGRTGLEAARAVHDWIAGNIRYIAVYLDPNAGWVPRSAAEVLATGYGDCKDHVVLLHALLAPLGIPVQAVLIDWGTRYEPYPVSVPHQFNHVIAYLPDFDLYANPTNPYARLGVLDRRLSGKMAVVATAEGRVVRTPVSRAQDNRYRLDSSLEISADGTLEGQARYTLLGTMETAAREDVARARSLPDLVERMLSGTPEGGHGKLSASDPKDLSRPFSVEASWSSPHGITFQGEQAFFATPIGVDFEPAAALLRPYLGTAAPRRRAILAAAMELEWSYNINLPDGYVISRLPADVSFSNETGEYTATYERTGPELRVTRRLRVARDVYPASAQGELRALFFAALDDARTVFAMTRLEARR